MLQRVIAVYGKGGSGKSFLSSCISVRLVQRNTRVLQIGCDPKHDSTATLFKGVLLPTILEVWREFHENGDDESLSAGDVIFERNGVYAAELGGPETGRGCGGKGIVLGFDTLAKLGLFEWDFDVALLDFLGDVVCGGFGMSFARSIAREIIIVAGNDQQSLYVANNVSRAVAHYAEAGSESRVLGIIINKDDGTGIAQEFAERIGVPVLANMPFIPEAVTTKDAFDVMEIPAMRDAVDQLIESINVHEAVIPKPLEFEEFYKMFRQKTRGKLRSAHPDELVNRASAGKELLYVR
ncbi:ArsA-related P-loop ATPase [Candidatus Chlorohelix sp.]|uniref:nucleotide-binding protein n=1 Tax=Candidatus Chlorohelix sp. TaxID=3139201 RepID=UPI00301EA04F